jgi:predicted nucleotidyltransferase
MTVGLNDIVLSPNQRQALAELRKRLLQSDVEEIILYGSVARREADEESDLDLLILTRRPFSRSERHMITDAVFEINLRYSTNFSTLVIDRNAWETGMVSVLPIRDEILREGIPL